VAQVIRDFESGVLRRIYRASSIPQLDDLPVPRYDLMNRSKIGSGDRYKQRADVLSHAISAQSLFFWKHLQEASGGSGCT